MEALAIDAEKDRAAWGEVVVASLPVAFDAVAEGVFHRRSFNFKSNPKLCS